MAKYKLHAADSTATREFNGSRHFKQSKTSVVKSLGNRQKMLPSLQFCAYREKSVIEEAVIPIFTPSLRQLLKHKPSLIGLMQNLNKQS